MIRLARTACLFAAALALTAPAVFAAGEQGGSGVYAVVKGPGGGEVKASLFSDEQAGLPIAQVGDRVVTLADLAAALGVVHQSHGAAKAGEAGKKDFTPVLNRLIGVRLIVQEAQAMGMDDLADLKQQLESYRVDALRSQLQKQALLEVKGDPAEVDRAFREAVREWKLRSALFEKEENAKALVEAAKSGTSFDALVAQAIAEKKASGGEAQWLPAKGQMLPEVLAAVSGLAPGQVSAPIKVDKGFAVIRLEEVRYPENEKARAEAQTGAEAGARAVALRTYYAGLVQKYVKVDEKLLKRVDFEAKKPGFKAREKDLRVVAHVEGGQPIRVKDLAGEMHAAFFHGIDQAITERKLNSRKTQYLDALVSRQIVLVESARLKIAESDGYKHKLADFHDQQLFAAFVERVIVPDITGKITEAEGLAWYEAHKAEFTYPAFYSLVSLGFETKKNAQSAADKVRAGTDLKWLKTNAEGLLPQEKRAFELDGGTVSGHSLSPEVTAAVAGAKAGDVRIAEVNRQHYVILVKQITPPAAQPYTEVRDAVLPKLQIERITAALDEWIGKLRKAHDVKVWITQIVS